MNCSLCGRISSGMRSAVCLRPCWSHESVQLGLPFPLSFIFELGRTFPGDGQGLFHPSNPEP